MGTRPRPATLTQVARFGAVAAVIRQAMAVKKLAQYEVRQALGTTSGVISAWYLGKSAPSTMYRDKLAALLEVKPDDLDWRQHAAPEAHVPIHLQKEERAIPMPRERKVAFRPPPEPPAEPLSFTIGADGLARLRLDVTLPVDKAAPLLRLLLDADKLFAPPAGDDGLG